MQEGRDHENESPEGDSAPSPSGEPAPSASADPREGTPGSSWVPWQATSPQDPPSGQAPGGEPARAADSQPGPGAPVPPSGADHTQTPGPAAPVPPASGETWPGQPGYPDSGYGQPGYAPPTYGPPTYAQPGYSQPGYRPPPGYGRSGPAQGEPSSPWQAQPGTQPTWAGPGQQQGWNPPPPGGPPYGSQPQPGTGAWPPYPAELPGGAPPTGTAPWPAPGGGYGQPPHGAPPSRGPGSRALVYLLVAVLAAAVGAGAVFALRSHAGNSPAVSPQDVPKPRTHVNGTAGLNVQAVANKVEPGMVDITSQLKLSGQVFEGTGMVLSSNGLVLTNNHVINGATGTSLHATLVSNGHRYPAQIVGWDENQDVALLKLVGASGLKTIHVGNSSTVKIGDRVVALGNAGGQGGTPTVTSGTITSLNRTITASDSGSDTSETLHNMFQSNAPIAPGDSGGPLADSAGQVIGMDTAANTQNLGGPQNSQGYSIPIDRALALVRQMAAGHGNGSVHIGQPPFIGIAIASASNDAISTSTSPQQQLRQLQKVASHDGGGVNSSGRCLPNELASPVPSSSAPAASGALVGGVFCDTPASRAGMTGGDVIVAVNGRTVTSAASLHTVIGNYQPGNTVKVTWVEPTGQKHTGSLTLAAGPVK